MAAAVDNAAATSPANPMGRRGGGGEERKRKMDVG